MRSISIISSLLNVRLLKFWLILDRKPHAAAEKVVEKKMSFSVFSNFVRAESVQFNVSLWCKYDGDYDTESLHHWDGNKTKPTVCPCHEQVFPSSIHSMYCSFHLAIYPSIHLSFYPSVFAVIWLWLWHRLCHNFTVLSFVLSIHLSFHLDPIKQNSLQKESFSPSLKTTAVTNVGSADAGLSVRPSELHTDSRTN